MNLLKKAACLVIAALCCVMTAIPVHAAGPSFTYRLALTNQSGYAVENPRELSEGDVLNVEIALTRTDITEPSYEAYGMEFRLTSRGLEFNNDGVSFRDGTPVTKQTFSDGDSVGFAYYDMEQKGGPVNNPVLAGRWSYTVREPDRINLTVPVSLVYVTGDLTTYEPVGNARLLLDPDGGLLDGKDVSGEYASGTAVTLPGAHFDGYVLRGWTDGAGLYQPGEAYIVTGFVTLKAVWNDFVRNRQVLFDANGGTIAGNDPSGMYADGEVIAIPNAEREERELSGWELGGTLHAPGTQYTVDNSVVFIARWKEAGAGGDGISAGKAPLPTLLLAALLCLLALLLLRRRKPVKYSLRTGNILLKHSESCAAFAVQVFLTHDGKEYLLGESEAVNAGETLTFILGQNILQIPVGKYPGRLRVTMQDGGERDVKCRVKVLDEDLVQTSAGQA